jgi:hypothetical protein
VGRAGLGLALEDRGRAEDALGCYLEALRHRLGHPMALAQHLALVPDDSGAEWVARGEQALATAEAPDEAKALVGYGIAKHHDRRGDHAQAARAARAANAARRRQAGPLDREKLAARVDGILLPGARVVHCRRDPRGNGLSIWMENFDPDQRYATDFDDLACFAGQCRRLMDHWRRVLPLPTLDVRYEDTVADLEAQARRLTGFLGVPWARPAWSSTGAGAPCRRRAGGRCAGRCTRARSAAGAVTRRICRNWRPRSPGSRAGSI